MERGVWRVKGINWDRHCSYLTDTARFQINRRVCHDRHVNSLFHQLNNDVLTQSSAHVSYTLLQCQQLLQPQLKSEEIIESNWWMGIQYISFLPHKTCCRHQGAFLCACRAFQPCHDIRKGGQRPYNPGISKVSKENVKLVFSIVLQSPVEHGQQANKLALASKYKYFFCNINKCANLKRIIHKISFI